MRRNPAPPYPNANLSATENRRRLKRWAAFGERWLKKSKALLTPSELEYSTVRNTLELAEWALREMRTGDPTVHKTQRAPSQLRLSLRSLDDHIHHDRRIAARTKKDRAGREDESPLQRLRNQVGLVANDWPTAYKNNKLRFSRLVLRVIKQMPHTRSRPALHAESLLRAGIPVRDLAPWHDDPKKFLAQARADGSVKDWTLEYDIRAWMGDIGLDEHDSALRGAISRMATAGGTFRRPSRQEAYRLKNQLEEERRKSEDTEKGPAIQKWLDQSERYRKHGTIDPGSIRLGLGKPIDLDLPPGWHQVTDADEVLRRSRADGLCLADTLAGSPFGEDEDQDGELSADALAFIVAQDRGKTVVGLNKNGVVRNRHHCTGKDNKFDKDAWDIFSKPRARRNPPSGYRVKLRRGRRLLHVVIR